MDQRKDLKPDGWEFESGGARLSQQPTLPAVEPGRRLNGGPGNANPAFTVATPLHSDMGAYWEVNINQANFNRLSQMDVIYIPIGRKDNGGNGTPTFFTEEQRRVLTRLADSGVTIWIDWAVEGPTTSGALGGNENAALPTGRRKNAFFTNLDFNTATGSAVAVGVGHPLTSAQFTLLPSDWPLIGKAYGGNPPSKDRAIETRALDMQATMNFAAVIPTTAAAPENGAYVAAGRYGAGYVVATAGNVGGAISQGIAANTGRITSQDLSLAEPEDLKLAYNIFAWASEVANTQKNSRHTGQGNMALDGMIEQGNYPNLVQVGASFSTYPPAGTLLTLLPVNPAAPLIMNGLVVSAVRTTFGSEMGVWELNPNDDFDGNGFIDDPNTAATPANSALIDYSVGQNYDRVETYNVGAGGVIYGIAMGELPELAPQGAKAYVFAGGTGGVLSFPAPRQGAVPNWAATVQTAPGLGITVTGTPAFELLPGAAGTARTEAKLYVGGIQQQGAFGSGTGAIAGLAINPANGAMAREVVSTRPSPKPPGWGPSQAHW